MSWFNCHARETQVSNIEGFVKSKVPSHKKKVQVGKDQEKAQSERDSHSKKPN